MAQRVERRKPGRPGTLIGASLTPVVAGIEAAKRSICIATPFMTADVARRIVRAADESSAKERRLLTALVDDSVERGYLAAEAIEIFADADFEIRSLLNLHAKVVLIDRSWAVIGSGNLTRAGVGGGNAELGIVLSAAQTRTARREFFDAWWQSSDALDLDYLRRLKPKDVSRRAGGRRPRGKGGLFRQPADPELANITAGRFGSGYWLKLIYGDDLQLDDYADPEWISDHDRAKPDGSPGGRKPGYRVGDHVVIYVARGARHGCPTIARVTRTPELDPDRVRREGSSTAADQWPWVTEIKVLHVVPLRRGVALEQIGVNNASIRQHDHIILSAGQYRNAHRWIAN